MKELKPCLFCEGTPIIMKSCIRYDDGDEPAVEKQTHYFCPTAERREYYTEIYSQVIKVLSPLDRDEKAYLLAIMCLDYEELTSINIKRIMKIMKGRMR